MENTFIHTGTVIGVIIVFIIGLVLGYLICQIKVVNKLKRQLGEITVDYFSLRKKAATGLDHLANEVKDFPEDVKAKVNNIYKSLFNKDRKE